MLDFGYQENTDISTIAIIRITKIAKPMVHNQILRGRPSLNFLDPNTIGMGPRKMIPPPSIFFPDFENPSESV